MAAENVCLRLRLQGSLVNERCGNAQGGLNGSKHSLFWSLEVYWDRNETIDQSIDQSNCESQIYFIGTEVYSWKSQRIKVVLIQSKADRKRKR